MSGSGLGYVPPVISLSHHLISRLSRLASRVSPAALRFPFPTQRGGPVVEWYGARRTACADRTRDASPVTTEEVKEGLPLANSGDIIRTASSRPHLVP
jgi:hypothetical protein